ncbi:hypothetical protein ABT061_17415 [Streptosporangium sp. NPDC002544]|uniref:hypothetical protein n=1 Tax=Streptosporangium sp. NPDC002544 TaxID=3154538 RepID=UPI0033240D72
MTACGWWRDQDWLTGDPLRRLRRRARAPDRTRALPRAEMEALPTRPDLALRERAQRIDAEPAGLGGRETQVTFVYVTGGRATPSQGV